MGRISFLWSITSSYLCPRIAPNPQGTIPEQCTLMGNKARVYNAPEPLVLDSYSHCWQQPFNPYCRQTLALS